MTSTLNTSPKTHVLADTQKFLSTIGHTDPVYIRCLTPKLTPIPELNARGMTWTTKDGEIKKSTIEGYISLDNGEFSQKYGDKYESITDGWGHLESLNRQGYGVYFVVHHGGVKNSEITHGSTLFHESDRASFDEQQQVIDRISDEFGKPAAVVKTRKSLHAYWSSSETIPIDALPSYQRRWMQYSNCDDVSLSDPAQLMRLPGFDHLSWNPELGDFDRVPCELIQLNDVRYSLEQFDRILPELDISQWSSRSLEAIPSDATDRDMRSLAPYLDGYKENGRDGWDTAKCPAHNGESSDSLHIDRATGGFICHGGCSSSAVYNATKARAVGAGHRLEVERTELEQDLKHSLELKNGKAPMVFGGELGKLLSIAAANFNIPTEILTFCLLPILASQIDSRTELLINPGTDYRVPAVRWCGLVGDTGSKKSPVLGLLTKALSGQQNELYTEYKANKLAYDAEYRGWKATIPKDRGEEPTQPAPLRDLYFGDFTIEGIILSLSNYPNSAYLLMLDELASFFSAMDAYRGGKGGDRQKWLTIWNGGGIKVNRKSTDTICVPQSSISIVGGIQPQTIANLIGGDDSQQDGLWNRFAFMGLPHNTTEAFTETPGDLREELDKVYRTLSSQETQTHCLSIAAKPLWKAWHDEIEAKTISESNWLIKGTYAKFEGIAGRNALIIHRTLAAIEGCEPTQLISADVLELAIAWTKFELNQTLSQYQLLAIDGTNPDQVRILKFIDKFKGQGWINARAVSRWWTTKPFPSVDKIRSFMCQVVSLGHAIDNGETVDSAKYQIQIPIKSTDNTDKHSTTVSVKRFERVGTASDNSTDSTDKSTDNLDGGVNSTNGFKVVGNFVGTRSDNSEPLINGLPVDKRDDIVGASTDTLNGIQNNRSGDFVSIVSTFPSDKNRELDNLKSMADSLAALTNLDEAEAIEGLSDLYSIWTPDQMSKASKLLKTTNSTAFDRLAELVVKRKSRQTDNTMVIENDVVMEF